MSLLEFGEAHKGSEMGKQVWYRGEGADVAAAKPGGHLHDFGDGLYLTDREDVAEVYSKRRATDPKGQRVYRVVLTTSDISPVLDLTADRRWKAFMTGEKLAGKSRLHYLKIKHELYGQFFDEFCKRYNIDLKKYRAVIGPEYNLV